MRAIYAAAGFGVLAIGLVLGMVVSGFTPGAEAAPRDQGGSGGRLIELGGQVGLASGATYTTPRVAVDDCAQLLVMVDGAEAVGGFTSPDGGTTRFNIGGGGTIESDMDTAVRLYGGRVVSTDTTSTLGLENLEWEITNLQAASVNVTAWAWCSFT